MITTSRSAIATYQACPRRAYWTYHAPNDTATPGWERRKLNIPYSTGIYTHEGLHQGFLTNDWVKAGEYAKKRYLEAVEGRGLAIEEGTDEAAVVDEQAHHAQALVLGFGRVRAPRILAEHEVLELEIENPVPLSDDVMLNTRADMITLRKADHRKFVWNFKTVATADDRWLRSWEVDMQLMTELLAAERRHGHEFGGVIIEGLIKGRRISEKDSVGTVTGYRDSSPLLYGYKVDANPPLTFQEYAYEYTRRKGWYRFPTWKETFASIGSHGISALDYWINWLPEEVVEAQFVSVPPIMRDADRIHHKITQIVHIEDHIRCGLNVMADTARQNIETDDLLDAWFPQNESECHWPSRCPCYDLCYTHGVTEDPAGSGLYQARTDHHAAKKEPVNG